MSTPHPGTRDQAAGNKPTDPLAEFVAGLVPAEQQRLLVMLIDQLEPEAAAEAMQKLADKIAAEDPNAFPPEWKV